MNSRQRFLATLQYAVTDRVPYFTEGIRQEVLQVWHRQGLSPTSNIQQHFHYDQREELDILLEPLPKFTQWPQKIDDLNLLEKRLNEFDPARLPDKWSKITAENATRDYPVILRLHEGFFLSLAVYDWKRFYPVMLLTHDKPDFVHRWLRIQGEFAARLADHILKQINIDAALFSEPIGGNHGPLISPAMYQEFMLPSFKPILDVLKKHAVDLIITRTYANLRVLLPQLLNLGFNCLWAVEAPQVEMDYLELRAEYGNDLRLIGGIDVDVLHQGERAMRAELEKKIPPLLQDGGYIPLLDGRVRENVTYHAYCSYRQYFETLTNNQ